MARFCFLMLVAWMGSVVAHGQDEKPTEEDPFKQRAVELQKVYQQHAEGYVITLRNNTKPLELVPTPVLNWVNRARVGQTMIHHGSVYVWTRDGRAEVVGTIFTTSNEGLSPSWYHELHSIATVPLKAEVHERVRWNTPDPGVTLKSFSDAEEPANTPARRLTQMRAMARQFSGYSMNYDKARWELNLLPQPIYRIPNPTDETLDQAIFAMVSTAGTDPEVLIVIEARKVEGKPKWQYAVCRFTDLATHISLGDEEVWAFKDGTNGAFHKSGIDQIYRFLQVTKQNAGP